MVVGPYLRLFSANVAPPIVGALGRILLEGYALAFDEAEEKWLFPELHDALPPFRRAMIETMTTRLRSFPGVRVEEVLNSTRNAYHREVVIGHVVITQCKLDAPGGPIREARHRETLARRSQMAFDWFTGPDDSRSNEEVALWACLVHMPADGLERPTFAKVVFPLEDGSWEEEYNLVDLVPSLIGYSDSPAMLKLREDAKRNRGAA